MAHRDAVRALEALTPWDRPAFRAGQLTPVTEHRPLIAPTTRPAAELEPTPVDHDTRPW